MMNTDLPIRVVCATRVPKEAFLKSTATGASIKAYHAVSPVEVRLFPGNKKGLSHIYNTAIAESMQSPAILVFMHDDIIITDFYWTERIRAALEKFDIVGLAGNTNISPGQPSWAFIDAQETWDKKENLCGCVAHTTGAFPVTVTPYGPLERKCKLLDGLLLAARSTDLVENNCRFDEQFEFHLYDVDFCRTATQKALSLGTFSLSVIHQSTGASGYKSDAWKTSYAAYMKKWGD